MSEEDAEQLKTHESYNPNVKKLASIMAQGLRDRTDLQEEKKKFNEWAKAAKGDDDDIEGQAYEGDDAAEV